MKLKPIDSHFVVPEFKNMMKATAKLTNLKKTFRRYSRLGLQTHTHKKKEIWVKHDYFSSPKLWIRITVHSQALLRLTVDNSQRKKETFLTWNKKKQI